MSVGENIRRIRKEEGLTQKDLANMLNVSIMSVSRYENAKNMNIATLEKISDALEVPVFQLLDDETDDALKITYDPNEYIRAPWIKEYRIDNNISLKEIGREIGLSVGLLKDLEATGLYPPNLAIRLIGTYRALGNEKLTNTEKEIRKNVHDLNSRGKNLLLNYSKALLFAPLYRADHTNVKPKNSSQDTTTPELDDTNAPE